MRYALSIFILIATFFLNEHFHAWAEVTGNSTTSKVIDQYRKALENNPSDSRTRYYLGISLLQHGDYSGGVQELLKVYPDRSSEPEINFNIGFAYLQMGRSDEAFNHFNAVHDAGGAYSKKYRLDSAFLNLGISYLNSGKDDKALKCFQNSLDITPDNIRSYLLLANLYSNRGNNLQALNYLEKARSIDDQDEELIVMVSAIHNRLGVDYLGKKQYADARREFQKVIDVDSSNIYSIYYLGYVDYMENNLEGASKKLQKLTSLKIEDENLKSGLKPLLLNIGNKNIKNNRPEKALEILDKVIEYFPSYSKAHILAATAAMDMKDYDRAIVGLKKYLELEPSDPYAASQLGIAYDMAKDVHFEKGKGFYKKRKYKESLEEFERTLEISPGYGPALKYRETVTAKLEKIRKAEEKRRNEIIRSLLTEGRKLFEDGELLAAKEKFLKASEVDPLNSEVEKRLKRCQARIDIETKKNLDDGNIYFKNKKYVKSIKSFRKVLYFDPENSLASQNIQKAKNLMESSIASILKEADSFTSRKLYRKAYNRYTDALAVNPEDDKALAGRDIALEKIDIFFNEHLGKARDFQKVAQLSLAANHYRKALNLKPADEAALRELSILNQKMGNIRSTGELISEGKNALSSERYNKAITAFSAAMKIDTKSNEAKKLLKRAKVKKKEKVDSIISSAGSLYKKGRYHDAIQLCRKALVIDKGDKGAMRLLKKAEGAIRNAANPHIARGKELFDSGDIDGAIIAFQKALRADPGNSVAKRYLSKVDSLQAIKVVEKEVKRAYLSGISHYTNGNYDGALKEWKNVLELDPDHEKATLNMDKARRKLAAKRGR